MSDSEHEEWLRDEAARQAKKKSAQGDDAVKKSDSEEGPGQGKTEEALKQADEEKGAQEEKETQKEAGNDA